jgi:hypothetical protein
MQSCNCSYLTHCWLQIIDWPSGNSRPALLLFEGADARTEKEQAGKRAGAEATNRERKGCDVIHNLGCFRIVHLRRAKKPWKRKALGAGADRCFFLFALLAMILAANVGYQACILCSYAITN